MQNFKIECVINWIQCGYYHLLKPKTVNETSQVYFYANTNLQFFHSMVRTWKVKIPGSNTTKHVICSDDNQRMIQRKNVW